MVIDNVLNTSVIVATAQSQTDIFYAELSACMYIITKPFSISIALYIGQSWVLKKKFPRAIMHS